MKIDLTDYSRAPEINWSMYRPLDLNEASSGHTSRDTGASARNSNSADSRNLAPASTGESPFISDHDLGLLVVLGLAVGSILSILVIAYQISVFVRGF